MGFFIRAVCCLMVLGALTPAFPATTQDDINQYEKLTKELEKNRQLLLEEGATDLKVPKGDYLFYLEYYGSQVTLYRLNPESQQSLRYKFAISTGNDLNYRASDTLIASAFPEGGQVVYRVYKADKKAEKVDELALPNPEDGSKWYAYALEGNALYYLKPELLSEYETSYTLYKWVPGSGSAPAPLFTLAQAGMEEVEGLVDFDIFGSLMLIIEDGRLWKIDLTTKKASWLKNRSRVKGEVYYDTECALYTIGQKDVYYFNYQEGEPRNITDEITKSGYQINDTYSNLHLFYADPVKYKNFIIYTGNGGIFAYDIVAKKIYPILLEPRLEDLKKLVYAYPQVTSRGLLFVKGLYSESGSTGFDGPLYMVDLKKALPVK